MSCLDRILTYVASSLSTELPTVRQICNGMEFTSKRFDEVMIESYARF